MRWAELWFLIVSLARVLCSRMLQPQIVGQEHYNTARAVQRILQNYKSLQDIIAILGNASRP